MHPTLLTLAATCCMNQPASADSWTSLDQELKALTTSIAAPDQGPKVSGWIQASVRQQSDGVDTSTPTDGIGDEDKLGFLVDQVRFHVMGKVSEGAEYKVGFDMLTSTTDLQDAYIRWLGEDGKTLTFGRFLRPGLASGMLPKFKLLFLQRTRIGALMYRHDLGAWGGVMLSSVALDGAWSNGGDNEADEQAFTLRVSSDLMGKGAAGIEGAYGVPEGVNLHAAAFACNDSTFDEGSAFGAEVRLAANQPSFGWSLALETASFGDDFDYNPKGAANTGEEGTTPWSATASLLHDARWELAVRFEDFDNAVSRTRLAVGANYYLSGHNLKWGLQHVSTDSDSPAEPDGEFALGATLAF